MDIEVWWPKLSDSAREWLIANNGDAIPEALVREIVAAGGAVRAESDADDSDGPTLSDDSVDWIEARANDET
ncbi:hypothetical protein SAMN06295885_0119 [Rathayibacter oskolensis]|uniref:Uncharacterized protein n=1 Tax=Rathayibacter oskolensis TaxID=1891671 RepID=A0A1X7MU15_9MICO|nr:hypothetical protein [Rathayibacter oskolensis]SMH28238.1 hypothetical protein SAMN06295885_0119 [Rathayibacter oskolensis]